MNQSGCTRLTLVLVQALECNLGDHSSGHSLNTFEFLDNCIGNKARLTWCRGNCFRGFGRGSSAGGGMVRWYWAMEKESLSFEPIVSEGGGE